MKRRYFLHSLVSAMAYSLLPLAYAKNKLQPLAKTRQRLRPTDSGWPSPVQWRKLGRDTNGLLLAIKPSLSDSEGALQHRDNPYWVGDQPEGTQNSGWLDAWSPASSVYAVKAAHAGHVAAAVNFARKHKLRLVVKGGGHSYLGTSSAPDSLLIWTRAMDQVVLHDAFVGAGCAGHQPPVPAVSAGAGTMWIDLYHAVTTTAGRYVQGGGCMTVGVAGLVQSGGFNSFSKGFGTAAANLLEAEIVTADGQIRVVNPRQEPELFWAIKGGGGGSFGVVTRLTLRTHDLPQYFGAAWGKIAAKSDAAFNQLLAHFIAHYKRHLLNPHWGERIHVGTGNIMEISMVSQGLDATQVQAAWGPFFDWVKASPDLFTILSPLGAGAWDARGKWDVQKNTNSMTADTREGAPRHHGWSKGDLDELAVIFHGYDSLWLPATLLEPQQQAQLVAALFRASRYQMLRLFFGKGLAGASQEVRAATLQTATNPAVVDAFALVIIADGEKPSRPAKTHPAPANLQAARKNAGDIAKAAAELRRIAPDSGSYVSESNYFNSNWQRDYWGDNYAKLRAVKTNYDPDGLFFVHHGVGSEDWSKDGFTRLS